MTSRLAATIVFGCLCVNASAQSAAPNLSRQQRDLLKAIVTAVDTTAATDTADLRWQHHVLRASDGSHYVAFVIEPPSAVPLPAGRVILYVRLATADASGTSAERSLVRDWLAGNASAPPPPPRAGVVLGEMPVMGATGNRALRPPTSSGMVDLQLLDVERRRAQQEEEGRERLRRAELEKAGTLPRSVLPFEDFDASAMLRAGDIGPAVSRALTAGPGNYSLFVAWADPSLADPASKITVVRTSLRLPPASADALTTSSIILADDVRVRAAPYPAAEQAAHPYSIGITEVTPAADDEFTNEELLKVFFQVINARPTAQGKPDIEIASRIVRLEDDREQLVASLTPLTYSAASMPAEFDLRRGHPVLAALSAPLSTLSRGSYRLKILVNDRVGGRSTQSDVDFSVRATPASLLTTARPMAPFRRESILVKSTLSYLVESLRPGAPSPALRRALDTAASGHFIELMVDEPVAKGEEGVRAVLTGLSQLSIGDASAAVQFQRGMLLGAAVAPARLLSGAARAMQGRDIDAIASWLEALKAGAPRELVAPLLLEAYIRRADYARAAALVKDSSAMPETRSWRLGLAALDIAQKNEAAALARLDAHLAAQPDDTDAVWLRIHALYAQVVAGNAAARSRFESEARGYIGAKGAHAAVAEEWLRAIS